MRKVGDMVVYSHEEMLDRVLGEKGTPLRNEHEERMEAFLLGEALKKARLEQALTQEQLGEKIGVKKAQISKLERGCNLTLSTITRVFKALGVSSGTLDLGTHGRVALW